MALHKNITSDEIHIVYAYPYASAAARIAASGFTSADVGKVAWQQNNNSFWVLVDDSPVTWISLAGGSAGAPTLAETLSVGNTTDGYDIVIVDSLITSPNGGVANGGLINIQAGSGADGGDIYITGGETVDDASGGDIVITGGAGETVAAQGGNIVLAPGDGTNPGVVKLQGDGAAILFSNVAGSPITPAAGQGLLWVDDTAPTTLVFTDSSNVDHTLAGEETLAQTLVFGNETGGSDLVISTGDTLVGETLLETYIDADNALTLDVNAGSYARLSSSADRTGLIVAADLLAGSASGNGKALLIFGGNAAGTGTGGSITLGAGTPTDGNGGAVAMAAKNGVGTNRAGGTFTITAGDATGNAAGGNITLTPGTTSSGTKGVVKITGDGAGILFDGLTAAPVTPASTQGVLWVDDGYSTSNLVYSDDAGYNFAITPTAIVTGTTSVAETTDIVYTQALSDNTLYKFIVTVYARNTTTGVFKQKSSVEWYRVSAGVATQSGSDDGPTKSDGIGSVTGLTYTGETNNVVIRFVGSASVNCRFTAFILVESYSLAAA